MTRMDPTTMEAVLEAQVRLLGLTITAEQRPGVAQYLALAAGMAGEVMGLAQTLQPTDESGSVFVPVEPT